MNIDYILSTLEASLTQPAQYTVKNGSPLSKKAVCYFFLSWVRTPNKQGKKSNLSLFPFFLPSVFQVLKTGLKKISFMLDCKNANSVVIFNGFFFTWILSHESGRASEELPRERRISVVVVNEDTIKTSRPFDGVYYLRV